MASKITKTKPLKKTEHKAVLLMRATAEVHAAQILAFWHGLLWALADAVWTHYGDDDFDSNNVSHWQGSGYRLAKECSALVLGGLQFLPALVVKNLNSMINPIETGASK